MYSAIVLKYGSWTSVGSQDWLSKVRHIFRTISSWHSHWKCKSNGGKIAGTLAWIEVVIVNCASIHCITYYPCSLVSIYVNIAAILHHFCSISVNTWVSVCVCAHAHTHTYAFLYIHIYVCVSISVKIVLDLKAKFITYNFTLRYLSLLYFVGQNKMYKP